MAMILKDQRFKPYIISLIFVFLNLVFLLCTQFASDYSLFGTNLDSGLIYKLSFKSNDPFYLGGINLITSIFAHQNLNHFLLNIVFFCLIGFATERYLTKVEYIFFILVTQIIPLLLSTIFISGEHLYLGSSLVCYGLFSLFALITARYYLFVIALTIISINVISSDIDWFSVGMHLQGLLIGVLYFYINTKLLSRRYKTY